MESVGIGALVEAPCSSASAMRGDEQQICAVKTVPTHIPSFVEEVPLVTQVSQVLGPGSRMESLNVSSSQSIQDIHISTNLMDEFMELAKSNTVKDLETCGILGACHEGKTFYVTTLIIPKQQSTSNTCQALKEEEICAIQQELSCFPVGWIHTHPSQSCFMSSIDLHTQYSHQIMIPAALAIVMAPTDASRKYGIFRLSDEGIRVLRHCQETGFHLHKETADGGPLYEDCSNVYFNPNLRDDDVCQNVHLLIDTNIYANWASSREKI